MDNALVLEGVYHEIMLRGCKGEEEQQWENARHEIMAEAIRESTSLHESYKELERY